MGDDGGVLVQHQGLLQYMGLHLISDHVINQPGTVEQQCPAQVHCTQHIVWSKQLAERLWRLSTTFPSSSHISLTHQVSTDCFHSFYWVVKEWTCSCEPCWMILKCESFYVSLHIFRVRTDLTCVTSHLRLSLELNRIESCGAPLTYRS